MIGRTNRPRLVLSLLVISACSDTGTPRPDLNPVPVLRDATPARVVIGSPATTITLTGTGFTKSSRAQLDGSDRVTTFLSENQLQLAFTPADLESPRVAQLTVDNPAPGGGHSAALAFTIGYAEPVLSAVSPASALIDAGQVMLTLRGNGFAPTSVVRWNGQDLPTSFDSATQLRAVVSGAALGNAGSVAITVTTPSPGGGTSSPINFSLSVPRPTLTGISPTEIFVGAFPFGMTLSGAHFVAQSQVTWNGLAHVATFVSPTSLHVDVASDDVVSPGPVTITVTNPAPGGGTSEPAVFTVKWLPLRISALSPTMISAGSGSFVLSVVGSGFAPGMVVLWNGQARATTYVNGTTLRAEIPAQDVIAMGTAAISVRNPAIGETTSALDFTIQQLPVPQVSGLSPANGVAGSGAITLTVKGSYFVPGMVVQLSGVGRPTRYVDPSTLTADISSQDVAAATLWVLNVRNPATGQLSNSFNFVVSLTPTPGPTVPIPASLWRPPNGVIPASGNYLYLESDPSDYVGAGQTRLIVGPYSVFAFAPPRAAAAIGFSTGGWTGNFGTMAGVPQFLPGYYGNAIRTSPVASANGFASFDWSGEGRGCNAITGWFAVDSVAYVGSTMTAFSARFEQHCEGLPPALRGAMRWSK